MAEVDAQDDELLRYVVQHYRYDPERHERRHVVVVAYDNAEEFERHIDVAATDLRLRQERGEADAGEWFSGSVLEPGYHRRAARKRLEDRKPSTTWQAPLS